VGMPLHVCPRRFDAFGPVAMGRLDAGHDPASTRRENVTDGATGPPK
jgi:hypothetical protein